MQAETLPETSDGFGLGLEACVQGAEGFRFAHRIGPGPFDQSEAKRQDFDQALCVRSALYRPNRGTSHA